MDIKEIFRGEFRKFIAPPPSAAWESYIQSVREGKNRQVPVYGLGEAIVVDYYGLSKKRLEQGRIHVLLGGGGLEISYHVIADNNGGFNTVCEGIFPRSD